MNRRDRRNKKIEEKETKVTFKESDFNRMLTEEVNKEWAIQRENLRKEIHVEVRDKVTRVIFNCMINALHGEYKFGAQRLQTVIDEMNSLMDGIVKGSTSVEEVTKLSKSFNLKNIDL